VTLAGSLPHLTAWQWTFAVIAALSFGLAKAGLAGLGLVGVVVFASLFGARDSTGVVLPLLLAADIGAVSIFKQHARWDYLRRTLPIAAVGVVLGTLIMQRVDNASFRPILGGVILALTAMQLVRRQWPDAFGRVPHAPGVGWGLGLLAGVATMIANAAGPVVALYYTAVGLPKFEVVGTTAWFFFLINIFKIPFSISIGVIHGSSLLLDAVLLPPIIIGLFAGRWLMNRISQRTFDLVLLVFAAAAAVRLIVA
jgi:uncharacterized membrane protein YfcA